ncbi:MAG: hypothetical protein Kow0031_20130 [Anaerolineae bacterium]
MRTIQLLACFVAGLMLLAVAVTPLAYAAPPNPVETPAAQIEPPPNGSAIRPGSATLGPDAVTVPQLPARSLIQAQPAAAGGPAANLPVMVQFDGEAIRQVDAPLNTAGVTASDLTRLLTETYESGSANDNPLAQLQDGNGTVGGVYSWGAESCYSTTGFPVQTVGNYSAWVAGAAFLGSPSLNPCPGSDATYPPLMNAWLVYGPFDLSDVRDASLDFFYRYDSPDPDDYLFWGASVDGVNFEGYRVFTGVYTSGPFPAGHNFASFNLTDVPILGDVTGQSQVYLAFLFVSDDDANTGQGAFIDSLSLRTNDGTRREITVELFENTFPTGYESWLSHDNNGFSGGNQRWGSADCNAKSGAKSMWLARNGAEGFDPCTATSFDALKQRDLESWLLYGPFSLERANEAWVEFYFRSDTERNLVTQTNILSDDIFYWWVSVDGTNYFGPGVSGTYINGPYGNGHNLMRFDLSNEFTLGDLRGRKNVWISFVMDSDYDENFGQVTEEGVFLDDVKIVTFEGGGKLQNPVFLPAVIKSPPPKVGGLTFRNFTGNPVVVELIGVGTRRFPGTNGPHVWSNLPEGVYDWIASGTCPAGAGQVGSQISSRQKVTIVPDELDAAINVENGGKFDCSG